MSQLHEPLTQEKNNDFPSGNLDEFISSMQVPKQDMNINETDGLEDFVSTPDEEENEKVDIDMTMTERASKATSKLVCSVIDTTIPSGLAWIGGNSEDTELYKATKEQREELEDAMTAYIRLRGGEIPPSIMVLILILTIYGSKLPLVIQQRKLNKQLELLENKQKELDKKIIEFEREKEKFMREKVSEEWEQQKEPQE